MFTYASDVIATGSAEVLCLFINCIIQIVLVIYGITKHNKYNFSLMFDLTNTQGILKRYNLCL